MREIKFRAWNPEYGMTNEVTFCDDNSFSGIYEREGDYWIIQNVAPMQYTGLKDANGREIYEGDILTGARRVEWANTGEWVVANTDGTILDGLHAYLNRFIYVIGNIYENLQPAEAATAT